MKKTKLWLVVILSCTMIELYAFKSNPNAWLNGVIHLTDGRVLSGKLQCQMQKNVVLYQSEDGIQTYPAILIKYFEVRDKKFGRGQIYYSSANKVDGYSQKAKFYELITQGKLTLLSREKLVKKYRPKGRVWFEVSQFYFQINLGLIQTLRPTKNNILKIMSEHAIDVNNYIKLYDLKINDKADLKLIFEHYNTLVKIDKRNTTCTRPS